MARDHNLGFLSLSNQLPTVDATGSFSPVITGSAAPGASRSVQASALHQARTRAAVAAAAAAGGVWVVPQPYASSTGDAAATAAQAPYAVSYPPRYAQGYAPQPPPVGAAGGASGTAGGAQAAQAPVRSWEAGAVAFRPAPVVTDAESAHLSADALLPIAPSPFGTGGGDRDRGNSSRPASRDGRRPGLRNMVTPTASSTRSGARRGAPSPDVAGAAGAGSARAALANAVAGSVVAQAMHFGVAGDGGAMTGHTRRGTRTRSFDETLGNNSAPRQPPRGPSAPVSMRTPHARDRPVAPGGMGVANSDVLLAAVQGIAARFGVEQAAALAALQEAMTGQVRRVLVVGVQ